MDVERRLRADRLVRVLDGIPREARDVLVLTYFDGKSTIEAANHLGLPVPVVRRSLSQGLRLLGASLDAED